MEHKQIHFKRWYGNKKRYRLICGDEPSQEVRGYLFLSEKRIKLQVNKSREVSTPDQQLRMHRAKLGHGHTPHEFLTLECEILGSIFNTDMSRELGLTSYGSAVLKIVSESWKPKIFPESTIDESYDPFCILTLPIPE